jgi:hypothetical protein
MATFGSMADEVGRKLAGYTLRNDRQTYLISALNSTSLGINVASAENVSNGMIEIGDELIYIDSYDRVGGTLTVPPYGRGYDGTESRSHATGSKVVVSPTFPRFDIKAALNETVNAVFPDLYATTSTTFTYSPAVSTYALPDDCETVLGVSYQSIGPSKEWVPVRNYRVDTMSNMSQFNSRNTLTIYSGVESGRTVQVSYSAAPTEMLSDDDDFGVATGLPESSKDVIVFGAAARLASFIDPGRLTFGSAESDQMSQVAGRSYGAGTNASKYLLAIYQQRLQEESRKLSDRNPIRIHFTR